MRKFLTILFILLINFSYTQDCGHERWNIKTLSDIDTSRINFKQIIPSTIHEQILFPKPSRLPNFRLPLLETLIYTIDCYIIGYKLEADKDIHFIIEDPITKERMVAELPSPLCSNIQKTSRYNLFVSLQNYVKNNIGKATTKFNYLKTPILVTMTGVGYFDFIHGQNGMPKNGREIHPILNIEIRKTN